MKTIFELALEYAQAAINLGPLYYDKDRNEVPELWIAHDEAYRKLWEAQQQHNGMERVTEKQLQDLNQQLVRYQEASRKAQSASRDGQCTKHVNVTISKSWPHQITGYYESDWFNNDYTVATYYKGELQE